MKILVYKEGRDLGKVVQIVSVSSVTQERRSSVGCGELGHAYGSLGRPLSLSSGQSLPWEHCTNETKHAKIQLVGHKLETPGRMARSIMYHCIFNGFRHT